MIITTRRCLLGGQTSFRTANGPATRRRLNRRKRSSRPAPRRVNGDSGVSAGLARRRSLLGFNPRGSRPLGTWICPGDGTAHSTIRWRCSILVGRVFQAPRPNQTDRTPRPSPRGHGRKVGVISAPHHSFSGQLLLRTGQQLTSLPDGFVVRASLARIRAKDHPRPAWVAMRCLARDSVCWIGSSQLPLCLKALPLGLTVRLELSSTPSKADGMTTLLC